MGAASVAKFRQAGIRLSSAVRGHQCNVGWLLVTNDNKSSKPSTVDTVNTRPITLMVLLSHNRFDSLRKCASRDVSGLPQH